MNFACCIESKEVLAGLLVQDLNKDRTIGDGYTVDLSASLF